MTAPAARTFKARSVVATCLMIVIVDGVDVTLFGATLPTLLEDGQWGMTAAQAGLVGSVGLLGMAVGAMLAGFLTDLVGRRPIVLTCVLGFSVLTALCAVAPNVATFGALRFFAGVGFGGALPTVIALTMEYVPRDRRQFYSGVVQLGLPIGGVLLTVAAIAAIPNFGWQSLYVTAGVLGAILFGIAYRTLPESLASLVARGRHDEARELAARYAVEDEDETESSAAAREVRDDSRAGGRVSAIAALSSPGYRLASIIFPVVSFCGLLLNYGMATWTPQILRASGYDLGSALTFLIAFNVGAAFGVVLLNDLAGRFGSRRVLVGGFLTCVVALALLAGGPATVAVYLLIVAIGFGGAAQNALYGFVGVHYPLHARGSALGLVLGLGRLGGVAGPAAAGVVVGTAAGAGGVYLVFGGAAVLAAVLISVVPRAPNKKATMLNQN